MVEVIINDNSNDILYNNSNDIRIICPSCQKLDQESICEKISFKNLIKPNIFNDEDGKKH